MHVGDSFYSVKSIKFENSIKIFSEITITRVVFLLYLELYWPAISITHIISFIYWRSYV